MAEFKLEHIELDSDGLAAAIGVAIPVARVLALIGKRQHDAFIMRETDQVPRQATLDRLGIVVRPVPAGDARPPDPCGRRRPHMALRPRARNSKLGARWTAWH